MMTLAGLRMAAAVSALATAHHDMAIVGETAGDASARELLLDRAFGPGRHLKTSARMRAGRLPADGLSLLARSKGDAQMLGSVRLWAIALGNGRDGDGRAALLLGPLGIAPEAQGVGVGGKLMRHAIAEASFRGHAAILLVGDPDYYRRFGFLADHTTALRLPGPVEQRRFLGLELRPGALSGARGLIRPTGAMAPIAANDAAACERAG